MKTALTFLVVAAMCLIAIATLRTVKPANLSSNDPAIRVLEEKYRSLAGFSTAIGEMETKSTKVMASLWSPQSLDAFVADLPNGWIARPLSGDTRLGIAQRRYAFSKDAATLRDYPEFQRVLKKLEERPSTRIDTVTLTVNADGKRFATALITATIPVSSAP